MATSGYTDLSAPIEHSASLFSKTEEASAHSVNLQYNNGTSLVPVYLGYKKSGESDCTGNYNDANNKFTITSDTPGCTATLEDMGNNTCGKIIFTLSANNQNNVRTITYKCNGASLFTVKQLYFPSSVTSFSLYIKPTNSTNIAAFANFSGIGFVINDQNLQDETNSITFEHVSNNTYNMDMGINIVNSIYHYNYVDFTMAYNTVDNTISQIYNKSGEEILSGGNISVAITSRGSIIGSFFIHKNYFTFNFNAGAIGSESSDDVSFNNYSTLGPYKIKFMDNTEIYLEFTLHHN